jgi:hypothetical protein
MLRLMAAALTAAVVLFGVGAAQAEDLEFVLINKSDSNVVGFYVSHTGTKDWEENLIEGSYLPSGNELTVTIQDGRTACEYDVRTEFEDGSTSEDYDLNLCELGSYTFQ